MGFSLASAAFSEEPKPAVEGAIAVSQIARATPVDFQKEILPLFKKSCTACHNQTDAKGDLVLESPQTILTGGESGPAVVPGKGTESLLFKLAAHQAKPVMPPKNNKANAVNLKPEELGLIKLWIDQGAKGQVILKETPIEWQPLPAGLNPIYSIAVSPDGQYVAAGRANQIFVYHIPTKSLVTRLTDPALKQPGNAHRDLVQSLAFNPQGDLLASGGYRVVKLWRRPANVQKQNIALGAPGSDVAISADGKWLATSDANNTVKLFSLADGKPVRDFTGHAAAINDFKFSADGSKLLTASNDKTVRLFNVADGKELSKLETVSEILSVIWLAKEAKFATGHADAMVHVWDVKAAFAEKKPEAPAPAPAAPSATPAPAAAPAPAPAAVAGPAPLLTIKQGGPVSALAALPNDVQFLAGSQDGAIHHLTSENDKSIKQFPHGSPVTALAVRPDGIRFASAGGPSAKLWNLDSASKGMVEIKGLPETSSIIDDKTRLVTLDDQHIAYYKKLVTDTETRKKAESEALTKATEAKTKAEEDLKAKDEALKKATEAKAAADKALVDAETVFKQSTEAKTAADGVAAKAKEEATAATAKATEATAAFTKAMTAKTTAEAANTDRQAKLKSATDKLNAAKEALAKAAEDKAKMEAVKAAETELTDRTAKARTAADEVAAAVAALDAATKAKAETDKAKTEADAKKTAADAAKAAADKALADATNKKTAADTQVKAQEKPFADAKAAQESSLRNRDSAVNGIANVAAGVKRVEEQLVKAQADLKASEDSKLKAAAELEAAKKAAADAVKPITTVAFSSNGGLLVTGGEGQIVQTWNGDDGTPVAVYRGHTAAVHAVAFSADGNVISAADQQAIVWDVAAPWKLERSIGSGETDSPLIDRVLSLAFSPDGKTLATGGGQPSRSGEVKLWNTADGALIREIKDAHSDTVFGLEFSFDGKHLASCAADKFVKTWNVADGKFIMSFEGHTHHVLGVSWMADGRTLASSGADGAIKIWDFVIGGQKRTIKGGDKEITAIRFIGITDTFITSAGDNTVKSQKENGSGAKAMPGSADAMHCAAVTPDGRYIVAGGQDSVVRVWNAAGAEVVKFEAPTSK